MTSHRQRVAMRIGAVLFLLAIWPIQARSAETRMVALGDIHGDLDNLRLVLRTAGLLDAQDHWTGGRTTLVQTGDRIDRGPDSRRIMDLFMKLQDDAAASKGRVICLLGNHEVMNIVGDLRYVSAEDFRSYVDGDSEKRRQDAYQQYARWVKQRGEGVPAQAEAEWMSRHPAGFIERREAFGPQGKYGKWLRKQPAIAQVEGKVFLHGGISPALASVPIDRANRRVRQELELFDDAFNLLVERRAILPFFTLEEMTTAAQQETARLKQELAAASGPGPSEAAEQENLQHRLRVLETFLGYPSWLTMHPDGPLWFRGFAEWDDSELAARLPSLLAAYHAKAFVVGHTVQPGRIRTRLDGKVFLIDTGLAQASFPGGRPSALEIVDDRFTALYEGERVVLVPQKLPDGSTVSGREPGGDIPGGGTQEPAQSQPNAAGAPAQNAPQSPSRIWLAPDGKPLPFRNDDELLEFLRTAKPISEKEVSGGITVPHKLLLEKDGVRANAIFRQVDEEKTAQTFSSGQTELFFRDSYIFEPAAYELNRMLGMNNVPPAVVRKVKGRDGSLQIWVENAMTETKRVKDRINPPDMMRWNKQVQMMKIFDALVYNTDRNRGNILITPEWNIWLIDHTRAFRRMTSLQDPKQVVQCERGLFQRLKQLDENELQARLKEYLRKDEIKAIVKRRKLIVERLEKLIAEQGEDKVLFTLEPPPAKAQAEVPR